jgi:hypothetical protein
MRHAHLETIATLGPWLLDLDDAREKVEGPVTVILDPSTSARSRGRQEAGDSQL